MTNVYTELYGYPSTITTLISFYLPNNTKKRIFILQLMNGLRKLDNWFKVTCQEAEELEFELRCA